MGYIMTREELIRRLERPEGRVRAVLDTDTYNEIDDQFALAYMLKRQDKFDIRALTAAPFHNEKSGSPGEGMKLSYEEILRVLKLTGYEEIPVFEGSETYLPNETAAVDSPAARELVRLSREDGGLLYIIAIGAITNVASALLLDPSMAERCVIVWLGGTGWHCGDTREFNMGQDIAAARVVFGSGAPVVQLPCHGVVTHLSTTGPELEHWLRGKNALCDFLVDRVNDEVAGYAGGTAWSRVIWDVSAVAWFIDPGFCEERVAPAPICGYDQKYEFDPSRHPCKVIDYVHRDAIFTDLFKALTGH
jgi:inosine-uridine nucleoside N-ribohydrolase